MTLLCLQEAVDAQTTEEHLNNATTTSSGRSVFCLQLPYLFSCAMK